MAQQPNIEITAAEMPRPVPEPGVAVDWRDDKPGLPVGPDDIPDLGPLPDFLNKGRIKFWGNDQFWLFPNLSIQIWARGYYITYTYWPEAVDRHIYEIDMYFVPPANARERLAQELVVDSTMEFAMQDVNTIEATHSALETRRNQRFHLSDQELLIRGFHKVIRDAVIAYRANATQDS